MYFSLFCMPQFDNVVQCYIMLRKESSQGSRLHTRPLKDGIPHSSKWSQAPDISLEKGNRMRAKEDSSGS